MTLQSILQVKGNNLSFLALKKFLKSKKQILSRGLSQNTKSSSKCSCAAPTDIQITVQNESQENPPGKVTPGPSRAQGHQTTADTRLHKSATANFQLPVPQTLGIFHFLTQLCLKALVTFAKYRYDFKSGVLINRRVFFLSLLPSPQIRLGPQTEQNSLPC